MRELSRLFVGAALLAACASPPAVTDSGVDSGASSDSGTNLPDREVPSDGSGTDVASGDGGSPPDTAVDDAVSPDAAADVVVSPDADPADVTVGPDVVDAGVDVSMMLPDVNCPAGQSVCGTSCVDTQSDDTNCGACGATCPMGQRCAMGVCGCSMGQTACGGSCVDTQSDERNCGACGTVCPAAQSCEMGLCCLPCAAPRVVCGAGARMTCTDTQTDTSNCGACGMLCPRGQSCSMGRCQCPMGTTGCGTPTVCVNTQSNAGNCGACGNVCGMGQACTMGVCQCGAGLTRCGTGSTSTCRNLQTDNANCGTCGVACAAGRVCAAGVCQVSCGGATPNLCGMGATAYCANFQSDNNNCGACGTVCAANTACSMGACRPTNDTPATAVVLPFELGNSRSVSATTANATNDVGACTGSTGTIYYRIDLTQRSIVYVDTFGTMTNTIVGFRTTSAGPSTSCNDNACGTMQSQAVIVAPMGALFIEVGTAMGGAGAVSFRYTIQTAGGGDVASITPAAAPTTVTGTTAGGTNGVTQSCGSPMSAPEDAFYFLSCPADPAREFHASTCGSTYDTVVETRSVGSPVSCNDNAGFECNGSGPGNGSSASADIPAGAGVHVVYVDGAAPAATGAYRLQFTLGNCNWGFASCGGNCVMRSSFNADRSNCGACGTVCGGALACVQGACGAPPANTFVGVQQPFAQSPTVGGTAGTLNTDDCPLGQVLVGFNYVQESPGDYLRSIQGVCGVPALGGSNPATIGFTPGVTLTVRGGAGGTVQSRRCPDGYAWTGIIGRAGGFVDQVQMLCSRVSVTGTGPYTVSVSMMPLGANPAGGAGGAGFAPLVCPPNQVIYGLATRSSTAVDAIAIRCERTRVFRASVNNTATMTQPLVGVANAGSTTFVDDCPAGQVLAGLNIRLLATGINQLQIACRSYTGLAGNGVETAMPVNPGWLYTTNMGIIGAPMRGTTTMGATVGGGSCPLGTGPIAMQVQNNTAGTFLSRMQLNCAALSTSAMGVSSLTAAGGSPVMGPAGAGPAGVNNCPANQLATGMEIRATANIQQVALRCTPVTSL